MHSTEALPLPPHPNVEQYRKLAKELAGAVKSGGDTEVGAFFAAWFEKLWRTNRAVPYDAESPRYIAEYSERLTKYFNGAWKPKDVPPPRRTLAHAQFVIAKIHGFSTWAALVRHIETLGRDSDEARFEAAVDAVVGGDRETLARLLREHPGLIKARSTRGHGATLLHYVSANGVEGYRQKTPANIVAITRLLLDAGSDVNATAACYGDDDTVLGLAATSIHPQRAGVMIPLLETLVAAGADVNYRAGGWTMIRACLANGQPEAAAWLAGRGSRLDLAGAAGIGRLDAVREFVAPDSTLLRGATKDELREAWEFAAWYGEVDVARYLLDAGMDPGLASDGGATALHRAAYAGHAELVELLLARGAPREVTDTTWNTTPLVWARHAWQVEGKEPAEAYRRIIAALGGDPGA
jgi:hypothetical protein